MLTLSNTLAGLYFVSQYFFLHRTRRLERHSFITTQFIGSFQWSYNRCLLYFERNSNLESPHYAVFPSLLIVVAQKKKKHILPAITWLAAGIQQVRWLSRGWSYVIWNGDIFFFFLAFNAAIAVSHIETCRLTSKNSKSYPSSHKTD